MELRRKNAAQGRAHLWPGEARSRSSILDRIQKVELVTPPVSPSLDLLEPVCPVHVRMEGGRFSQVCHASEFGGRHHEPSTSKSTCVVVQINPNHTMKTVRNQSVAIPVRVSLGGRTDQPLQPVD